MSLRKRESGFLVGTDETTGEDEYWGQDALRYGGYITMGARGGKTTLLTRLAHHVLGHGSPGIIIDDAGELWNQLRRSVAWSAWQLNAMMQDAGLTAAERLSVIRARYLDRYSFAFMGSGTPNHVTLDLLKRRRLPGRRETIEEVVSGNMRPFEARFKDIEIRTRFLSVIGPSLAALVAAERPITELWDLLLDPKYWWFIRSEIMRLRVLDDPVSREYLVPQMLSLRRILDMRIRYSKSTGPIEAEPYPQPYRDKIDSTLHAIEVYKPGTVTSRLFVEDSFSPESVAFGQGVFALTSDVGSELNRNLGITTLYVGFERLLKYRLPGFPNSTYRLFLFLDEVRWFYEAITRFFSVANNHRVSTWVLNQDDAQWLQLGMPALAQTLPKLLSGVRLRDAAGSREVADAMALADTMYDPVGMQHRLTTGTHTRSESEDESEGESDSVAESETESEQESTGSRSGSSGSTSERAGQRTGWREGSLDHSFSEDTGDAESSGWSEDSSDSRGSSSSRGKTNTRGTSRSRGKGHSKSKSTVEHVINIGAAEQHLLRMQREMQLPRFTVQQRRGNVCRYTRLAEQKPRASAALMDRVLDEFDEASADRHNARRRPRLTYNPVITISAAPPAAPEPVPAEPPAPPPAAQRAEEPSKPAGPRPSFTRRGRPGGSGKGGRR